MVTNPSVTVFVPRKCNVAAWVDVAKRMTLAQLPADPCPDMAAREQQNEQPKDYSFDNQDRIQNVLHVVVSDLADQKNKRPEHRAATNREGALRPGIQTTTETESSQYRVLVSLLCNKRM
jgi:hypothetical protein